ncbi:MAG: hypothetical protein CL582_11365 [Alteromonadaceae bacterium]|nr:hypothetical protein [Alteromonadaceae bacterium]
MTIESALVDELEYSYSEADAVEYSRSEIPEHSPLQKKLVYYNNIGEDLIVVDRTGIQMIIKSQAGRHGGLAIEKVYHVGKGVEVDPNNVSRFEGGPTKERKALNEAIEAYDNSDSIACRKMSVVYTVDRDKLLEGGYPLYVPEVDLVVAVRRLHEPRKVLHPYSDTSARYRILKQSVEDVERPSMRFEVFIVSNDRTHGDRYINVLGDVYKVPSVVRQDLQDGVYVCSSGCIPGPGERIPKTFKHYTHGEANEHIALYSCPNEARTFGDPQGEREREFRRLENEYKDERLDMERQMAKEKLEREKLRAEQADMIAELDHYRKLKEMKDKDYFDDRSRIRKDNSEVVKYIPAIITGILAVATLAVKLSDKK